jgi:integrase
MARKWGPVALTNEIQRVRTIFKYVYEAGLIANPMRFGPTFKRPSKKTMRKERSKKGARMFTVDELQAILAAATPSLRAMVLLGINAGFGNADCATLPLSAVDLSAGWLAYPRPKTGVTRRCRLWPETVAAIEHYLTRRPEPKRAEDSGLLFITKYGWSWDKSPSGSNHANPISFEMKKVLLKLKLYRPGLSYYSLRHTFRTVADSMRDQRAIDRVMGHSRDEDISTAYVEHIADDRLEAVSDVVHGWLFTAPPADDDQPQILKLRKA